MYTYEYPRPMLTADCMVVNPCGEILLIRRGNEPYRGCWALPGGFMEMDETIEHCAVRELQEETGIVVGEEKLHLIGIFSRLGRDPRGRTVTAAYHIDLPTNTDAQSGDDAAEARWFPLSELPPLAFDHAEIIARASN
ncbi:MAG: NUDIX hydrolase [Bacteroidales bacterium]|nr:NUDIX hydrolase [Bacteroidales bacterium]